MIIHKWESVASPIGAVQIIHGMAEHARRYARFASALNESGYIVWAHDQRGHGANPTPPVGLGHFADDDGWRLLVDDAASVSDRIRSAYPGLPLFVFAHSMGSFVAQSLMGERGDFYRGVVLSGSDGPRGVSEAVVRSDCPHPAIGSRIPCAGPLARFARIRYVQSPIPAESHTL